MEYEVIYHCNSYGVHKTEKTFSSKEDAEKYASYLRRNAQMNCCQYYVAGKEDTPL